MLISKNFTEAKCSASFCLLRIDPGDLSQNSHNWPFCQKCQCTNIVYIHTCLQIWVHIAQNLFTFQNKMLWFLSKHHFLQKILQLLCRYCLSKWQKPPFLERKNICNESVISDNQIWTLCTPTSPPENPSLSRLQAFQMLWSFED